MATATVGAPLDLRLGRIIGLSAMGIAVCLLQARAAEEPRISSPSPGAVSIAVGSAPGAAAVSVAGDGTIRVAATSISGSPQRASLFTLSLTSNGALANHATAPVGDILLNTGANNKVADVAIAPDGTIVVALEAFIPGVVNSQYGNRDLGFVVARFLPGGQPDGGFGHGGWTSTDVGQRNNHNIPHGVAVQPDGKIIVTGNSLVPYWFIMTAYSFATVRYNLDGSLDESFGDGGRVITRMGVSREDEARVALVQPDGKIVVVGSADSDLNVHCDDDPGARLLNCLGHGGRRDFALIRYLPNGHFDKSFGKDGRTGPHGIGEGSSAYHAALDTHNRVVTAGAITLVRQRPGQRGSSAPALARYTPDGNLDTSFGNSGVVQLEADGPFGEISTIAVQADDKIVALGHLRGGKCRSCSAAMRLNADGAPDKEFGDNGTLALPFDQNPFDGRGIAIQQDGKIVLAGARKLPGNQGFAIVLIRLNSDGTPDTTFGMAGTP